MSKLIRLILLWHITCLLCHPSMAQGYFGRLPEQALMTSSEYVDTILSVPYDAMVGDFETSEFHFRNALRTSRQSGYASGEAKSCELLGLIMYLQGSYDSSAFYNLEAMKLYEATGEKDRQFNMYCQHGYQMKRRNLQEAFAFMRKGIVGLESLHANEMLIGAYDNFGVLFEMRGDIDSALVFYHKSLGMKESANDSIGLPFSLNKIAFAHLLRNDAEQAIPYLDRAYGIRVRHNDSFGIIENLTFYGDYYRTIGQHQEAIKWYELSNEGCDSLKYPYQKQYNLEQLSICFEQLSMYREALFAGREAKQLSDSLLNEKNARAIIDLEKKYQLSEKNLEIAELDQLAARRKFYVLAAVAFLLIATAFFMFRLQVLRRKSQHEKDQAIIAEREAGLKAVFDATEEERKRIARDLHDGIGQRLSGLKMGWEALRHSFGPDQQAENDLLIRLTSVLDETASEVRSLSHQMMPRSLQENGLIPAISDMLEKSLGVATLKYTFEHYKAEGRRFEERVELGVYRICQELISNIIRHSQATEVVVQILVHKGHLVLIVEDNGKGIKGNQGGGIGLRNMTSRINTVNGNITLEPSPGSGTVATIRIPVS